MDAAAYDAQLASDAPCDTEVPLGAPDVESQRGQAAEVPRELYQFPRLLPYLRHVFWRAAR